MTKLMFALWGDLADLHSPEVHGRVEAAGGIRMQVNVADEEVERAMRISTFEPGIDGFATVWTATTSVAQDLVAALHDVGDRVVGWEVEERRPIEPPDEWDGSRLDGLANIAVLRRPEELTQEEWLRRWREDHTPVAIATQATFGYVQNLVVAPLTEETPEVSGLVEELFPTAAIDDMHAFYGTEGDDAELSSRLERLMASVARIGADRDLDLVPTSRYLYPLQA
ncbi:MAG TPA: EthD domain-containing protein [Nocardioides sp.]|nr:EthD domain-containing protein [Nocardioides sp.]